MGWDWVGTRCGRIERSGNSTEVRRTGRLQYSTVRHRNRNGNRIDVLWTFARGARDAEHSTAQHSVPFHSPANSHYSLVDALCYRQSTLQATRVLTISNCALSSEVMLSLVASAVQCGAVTRNLLLTSASPPRFYIHVSLTCLSVCLEFTVLPIGALPASNCDAVQ